MTSTNQPHTKNQNNNGGKRTGQEKSGEYYKAYKTRKKQRHYTPLLANIFRPVLWVVRGLAWACSPSDEADESIRRGPMRVTGRAVLFGVGTIASFAMSTESFYVLLHQEGNLLPTEATADIRFIPKFGIDDGAELGRIIPSPFKLGRIASNVLLGWIPGYGFFQDTAFDNHLVWLDGRFYIAAVVAGLVNIFEGKALRSISLKLRKQRLDRVKDLQVEQLSDRALDIARIRAMEYKSAKVGSYIGNGAAVIATYATEIGMFVISIWSADLNFVGVAFNGLFEIFGFEFCLSQTGVIVHEEDLPTEEVSR